MKKKSSANDLFFLIFAGEMVVLTTTSTITEIAETGDNIIAIDTPMLIDGYLLDANDEYYFLGENAKEVTKAVRKDKIIEVEIKSLKGVYDQILDGMDEPETDKEIN